ncbi:MAG: response regulator [Chitinophagaceae bacterium]|nr:response regulator [Chitinophagaceae bacterium]
MFNKISGTVFIVDDNDMLSMALEDYITEKTPHKVRVFATGEDCIRHLDDGPDVVILDYYLNSVKHTAADGSKILQAIKRFNPGIHVIMLSGQDAYGAALQTIMKGADSYVIKDSDAFTKVLKILEGLR